MKKLTLIGLLLALTACEKEINLPLKEASPRLVVEGAVERMKDGTRATHFVKLSTTGNYFTNSQTPRVLGARVSVIDERGTRYSFQEKTDQPGVYQNTELTAELYHQYTLRIELAKEIYEARETLLPVSDISRIYTAQQKETLFDDAGTKVLIDFLDPGEHTNYYLWQQYVDGQPVTRADPGNIRNLIAHDRLFNGQWVRGYVPNEESLLTSGQQVVVRQISLSRQAYDFYYLLFLETGKTGQLFDTPPATIRGNVVNLTTPARYALGYFEAREVAEKTIIVP